MRRSSLRRKPAPPPDLTLAEAGVEYADFLSACHEIAGDLASRIAHGQLWRVPTIEVVEQLRDYYVTHFEPIEEEIPEL